MRQVGVIAACVMYALKNNIARLQEDHNNAKLLAQGLSEISELENSYMLAYDSLYQEQSDGVGAGLVKLSKTDKTFVKVNTFLEIKAS
jgi:hypothetical protein